ncbi:MAG: hypothetical protein ACJAZF_004338 [Granulosicoccus sp.]|jgi:hypothetical protein
MITVASHFASFCRLSGLFWLVCLMFFISSTKVLAGSIDTLNKVPVPPGTRLSLVSAESVHNGASVAIATFESRLSLDDTLAFYKNIWPNEPESTVPGRLESVVGDWLLISRLHGDVNTVIQLNVTKTSRSTGFLSVMAINSPVAIKSPAWGAPKIQDQDGYLELSRTTSEDGSLSSTTSVLESNQSMSNFIQSLLRLRVDAGWQLSSQKQHAGSQIVLMNRQSQRVEMVISEDRQGTVLAVINEVRYAN